ncbi:hypothetical protein QAO71_10585 [Halopseudomonas sp. SMJS2]|uniref:hypothetical protein n=1 Tax=Halopseudomonas sp. SMJS2 TaxID=3041098 RepID=UPI0024534661|nr:hypothetical protein [Halopseudomonas sp. SMJS2]WGK60539.1 hypothetical protein QAO71_10585 [Halopseudomonas sp. SMJS2]
MIENGKRLEHKKSENHINEFVDSFNILNSTVNQGSGRPLSHVVIMAARMQASLTGETFMETSPGHFSLQAAVDDVVMEKVVFANLTCTLDVAKQLVAALNKSIAESEKASALDANTQGE